MVKPDRKTGTSVGWCLYAMSWELKIVKPNCSSHFLVSSSNQLHVQTAMICDHYKKSSVPLTCKLPLLIWHNLHSASARWWNYSISRNRCADFWFINWLNGLYLIELFRNFAVTIWQWFLYRMLKLGWFYRISKVWALIWNTSYRRKISVPKYWYSIFFSS